MDGEDSKSDVANQDWSLRRYNRAHVFRVYELCGRDVGRAASLLELTQNEVKRWVESSDDDSMAPGGRRHIR
ncbi:MAG: hypothetical protein HZB26_03365 [Candidatus Hydrogenedentes bacterium]|nr:hypothetical protein [Candidatus Hydrogenedentota bacterium]